MHTFKLLYKQLKSYKVQEYWYIRRKKEERMIVDDIRNTFIDGMVSSNFVDNNFYLILYMLMICIMQHHVFLGHQIYMHQILQILLLQQNKTERIDKPTNNLLLLLCMNISDAMKQQQILKYMFCWVRFLATSHVFVSDYMYEMVTE
jgi:hypothetical protein